MTGVPDALEVVREWIDALNAGDVERMIGLAHEDIVFDTRRGLARGQEQVRAFMARQGYGVAFRVVPSRYFVQGDTVVVDALNELRYVDSGELADSFEGPATFRVDDGHVTHFASHADLDTALRAAGMTRDSESSPD